MKLEERNQKSKVLYNRLNLIMAFCNQLPELFRLATPEIKREIVQTCVRTLTYNGETLQIELFPVFYKMKYWKNVKNGASYGADFEPNCIQLAHYLLHSEYELNTIRILACG